MNADVVRAVSPGPHYITSFPTHQSNVRCRPSCSACVKNEWSCILHPLYAFVAFKGRTLTFHNVPACFELLTDSVIKRENRKQCYAVELE